MRLIIAGTRELPRDFERAVWDILTKLCPSPTLVMTGENTGVCYDLPDGTVDYRMGVDRMGKRWASYHGYPYQGFPADWNTFGKGAGPKRNGLMAAQADLLIAFPLDSSIGTADMIAQAKALGVEVKRISLEAAYQKWISER